ncbi:hypothetical protein GGR53DRAFT_159809 [Hypoxylon sp. FL1150]|nr:hypothetical protein GGR53DRAFT_159809 [Hypoxylon sp. FL1150]
MPAQPANILGDGVGVTGAAAVQHPLAATPWSAPEGNEVVDPAAPAPVTPAGDAQAGGIQDGYVGPRAIGFQPGGALAGGDQPTPQNLSAPGPLVLAAANRRVPVWRRWWYNITGRRGGGEGGGGRGGGEGGGGRGGGGGGRDNSSSRTSARSRNSRGRRRPIPFGSYPRAFYEAGGIPPGSF